MANVQIPPASGAEIQQAGASRETRSGNVKAHIERPAYSEFVVDPVDPVKVDRSPVATKSEMLKSIEHLNQMLKDQGRNVSFSYDEQIDHGVVRVVDNQSGELIRQFPSEELMHAYKHLDRMMGVIFDGWV